ncbi:ubiquitin carboxyl-terminal hydrolase family protein, putative [Ichthyophthirius multifiliis]|uniref:Ubiquitin carboxyl-terminal hydrolase family protein, putative n=1 Tax=Ichthyophthirius multifiliis TaxID=5932 RepID=G0QKQ4_ICHMU|nr:ubiquitin carboxyl-terminal hydrolase family protein, putative [Ichthyophthirius multifiliis]EGR34208.1 ubiquitin carboxyl-terminal hydrolase family protein, putative [Ichthyophthirius multifiliis]|eukprot:XP_004039512.1 ubiquitin carboxyl-terminal hydrolase family protein, putative [Ichthyophthirius multifiliis]
MQNYIKLNQYLDVMDNSNNWCVGKIISIEQNQLYINFDGWKESFNEVKLFIYLFFQKKIIFIFVLEIKKKKHFVNSKKILPFRSKTQPYTGAKKQSQRDNFIFENQRNNINQELEKMMNLQQNNFQIEDTYQFIQYVRGSLFILGDSILTYQKALNKEDMKLSVEFFQVYISFFCKYLQTIPQYLHQYIEANNLNTNLYLIAPQVCLVSAYSELFELLLNILGERIRGRRYYSQNQFCLIQVQEPFAIRSKESYNNQMDQIINFINCFGSNNGFDHLINLINWQENIYKTPLNIIVYIQEVMNKCIQLMPSRIQRMYLDLYEKSIFQRISKIQDKEMKDIDIPKVRNVLRNLLPRSTYIPNEREIFEAVDKAEIQFALKLLKCQYLEKKFAGIVQIKEIIEHVCQQYGGKILQQQQQIQENIQSFKYMNKESLKMILEQEGLLDFLLGENYFHPEIFKKSLHIFVFMAEIGGLQKKHIENLWKITENKHEADLMAIYEVIISLSKVLNVESLEYLFKQMSLIKFEKYTDLTINLLKDFSQNAGLNMQYQNKKQKIQSEFPNFGLEFLWEALQDQNKVNPKLIHNIVDCLCFLLKNSNLKEQYIQMSFENVRDGKSVCQSIQVIIQLLKSYKNSSVFNNFLEDTQQNIVVKFNKEFYILDLLVKEFECYYQSGQEQMGGGIQGKYTHEQNVDIRLELIQIVSNALQGKKWEMNIEQVKKLWVVVEKKKLLKWILVKNGQKNVINEHLYVQFVEKILLEKELMKDYNIDKESYEFVRQFLIECNIRNGKSIEINQKNVIFVIKHENIIGKEFFWNVLLFCENQEVLNFNNQFIPNFYVRKAQKSSEQKIKLWKLFINKCKDILQMQNVQFRVQFNIVKMVKFFLQELEGKMYFDIKSQSLQIYIQLEKQTKTRIMLNLDNNISILHLRKIIGEQFIIQNKDFDLFIEGKNYIICRYQEEEYNIQALVFNDLKQTIISAINIKDNNQDLVDLIQFKQELVNDSFGELLFEMLSQNNQVELIQNILETLNNLPKIQNIVKKIENLNQVNELFSQNCYLKLQYCLLIIQQYFLEQEKWCKLFLSKNGIKHLINIYQSIQNINSQHFFSQPFNLYCLQTLAEIINHFIMQNYANQSGYLQQFLKSTMQLIIRIFEEKEEVVIEYLSECKKILEFIVIQGLLNVDDKGSRKEIKKGLQQIVVLEESKEGLILFENLLNQLILKESFGDFLGIYKEKCIQFFDFYEFLLDKISQYEKLGDLKQNNLVQISLKIIEIIKKNQLLRGAFQIALKLLNIQENLFQYIENDVCKSIIQDCLFNIPPKCKSLKTRNAAFKVLVKIQSKNMQKNPISDPNQYIEQFLKSGFWRQKSRQEWNKRQEIEKNTKEYVGLKNLGSTCYMNSLFQQLFMIKEFSQNLLKIRKEENNDNNNTLFFFNQIMQALSFSQRQFYDCREFCFQFKDFDGQPTNVMQQMDVDEFFNTLMDRLETDLKPLGQEFIIKDIFEGQLANELIGKGSGCEHCSERNESFMAISLPIKNKKSTLGECLDSFVQGEMLDGDNSYFCEKCNAKVPTLKQQSIKKLPNLLIIVLKRFHFDIESMQKTKINAYCEFPFDLDMKQYTKLNEENEQYGNEYFQYKLRGIIIHQGTSDSGHYYSIIQEKEGNWMEFNDMQIQPFDIQEIQQEGFGGFEEKIDGKFQNSQQINKLQQSQQQGNNQIHKNKNAYMLFYERVKFFNFQNVSNLQMTTKNNHLDLNGLQYSENYKLHLNKYFFSKDLQEYVVQLIKIVINQNQESLQTLQISKFGFFYYFFVLIRSYDKSQITFFRQQLALLLQNSYSLSTWLIQNVNNINFIKEIYVQNPVDDMKCITSGLILQGLKTVCEKDDVLQFEEFVQKSCLVQFVNLGFSVLNLHVNESKLLDQFFRLICKVQEMSNNVGIYMFQNKIINRLNAFFQDQIFDNNNEFLGKFTEFELQKGNYQIVNNLNNIKSIEELIEQRDYQNKLQNMQKNYASLIKLWSNIIRMNNFNPSIGKQSPYQAAFLLENNQNVDIELYKQSNFLKKIISLCNNKQSRKYFALGIGHISFLNVKFQEGMLDCLKEIYKERKFDDKDVKFLMVLLRYLVQVCENNNIQIQKIVFQIMQFFSNNLKYYICSSIVFDGIIKVNIYIYIYIYIIYILIYLYFFIFIYNRFIVQVRIFRNVQILYQIIIKILLN